MNSNKFITRRFIAGAIDYTVILVLTYIYLQIIGEVSPDGTYSVTGWKTVPVLLFWLMYLCLVEVTLDSTLGNYIAGLQAVDLVTEENLTFKQSFLRHSVDYLDMMFCGIVAVIIIKNSRESQRLGDLLAKTKVVRRR
ncbi:RDD family protein [Chryseobacterium sp. cx-311]|uniref:RDD family protein n=1 Tax=Marnyiella aurantia TaxID=2758037 RepID=UPI001AE45191|nr:RDD family protein [Marnyiella aurantia]MBP0613479.1 RDD family protein [Marnyiella aurantia]